MPTQNNEFKQAVTDYKSELGRIRQKVLSIDSSVCDMDDVLSLIQSSTQLQEDTEASLDTFNNNLTLFTSEVVRIDNEVADLIRERTDKFYESYPHLKPEVNISNWQALIITLPSASEWIEGQWKYRTVMSAIIVGMAVKQFLGLTYTFDGLKSMVGSIPKALLFPGGGFQTQAGFTKMTYGLAIIASMFNSQIQADMDAIDWDPKNSDVSKLTGLSNGRIISFYKGMPVFWTNQDNARSGSFLGIFLTDKTLEGTTRSIDADTINHEWGHGVQQGMMGILNYAFLIGFPSYKEMRSDLVYYNRPWEISADMFGGVTRNMHTKYDIEQGWRYLWATTYLGKIGSNNTVPLAEILKLFFK
jgi:hypothetical protein